jgi:NTE family protein
MNTSTNKLPPEVKERLARFDRRVLVLQGGGALGAYQAGVFEGVSELGFEPDWVAGISIGAINSALIAGNPPERRIERLREFWDRASARATFMPPPSFDTVRPFFNALSAASAVALGVPGFFVPRFPPPFMARPGDPSALSFYDTQPLKSTLEELVDFDLINSKRVRLSLGAVNVQTGASVYFDNAKIRIEPEHVMASGALPPGFPPIGIDGEWYWDGGISSNTPMWYVVDENYRAGALILQIDLFSGPGALPQTLQQAQERMKDIQYSSRARFGSTRIKEIEEMRGSLRRVLEKLPKELRSDPDVQRLTEVSTRGAVALIHFTNHHNTQSSDFKDYEFSRTTMNDLWQGGLDDVHRAIERQAWNNVVELAEGIRIFDFTPLEPAHQEQTR